MSQPTIGSVLLVFGTRPEAIKMAPVVKALRRIAGLEVAIVVSAQHRQMLDQAMDLFGLVADEDLAGVEPEPVADDETDFTGLYARIDRAIDNARSYQADQIDGSESREIVLKMRNDGELRFSGQDFLLQFVLPNLFFHCTTAYAILRQSGVALGKMDFMGKPA